MHIICQQPITITTDGQEITINHRDPRLNRLLFNSEWFVRNAILTVGTARLVLTGPSIRKSREIAEAMFIFHNDEFYGPRHFIITDGASISIDPWKFDVPKNVRIDGLFKLADVLEVDWVKIQLEKSDEADGLLGPFFLHPFQPPEPDVAPSPAPADHEPAATLEGFNDEEVKNLRKRVDILEISVRSANCLQNGGFEYIFQVVEKPEIWWTDPKTKPKNFGRKSLNELKEILAELGLRLGMNFTPDQRAALAAMAH